MPVVTRGKIKFEETHINTEYGRVVNMFELSCTPPPTGSETHFSYSTKVLPVFMPRYMQPQEMSAMLEGAKVATENILTAKVFAEELAKGFVYDSLDIDDTKVPAEWARGVDCYKATVGYRVTYNVYEIKATSTEDFKVGNIEYPKDDTVAVFRMWVPLHYLFVRYYVWNPECCPEKTPASKDMDTSNIYPEIKIELHYNFEKLFEFNPWHHYPDYPNYYYPEKKEEDKEEKDKKEKKKEN